MRIIKSDNGYYRTFVDTLVETSPVISATRTRNDRQLRRTIEVEKRLGKFMERLIDFNLALYESKTFEEVAENVKRKINEVIEAKEVVFFQYDEIYDDIIPINDKFSNAVFGIIKIIKQDSIFHYLIQSEKIVHIPISQSVQLREGINNLLFVPVKKWKKTNYFVCVDTPIKSIEQESFESRALKLIISHSIPVIENIRSTIKLNKIYSDFQLFQSKFLKDYKLAAIGELTVGLTEEIISPMQVILSSLDLMNSEGNGFSQEFYDTIHSQVRKVKSVIKRLMKFSSVSGADIAIKPTRLNKAIKEYMDVVNANLKAQNFECILDLDASVPQILSHPSYLHVMLSTIFSIVRGEGEAGGMILQTRTNDENVFIKIITTNVIESLSRAKGIEQQNLDLLILENIVKKHEGKLNYRSTPEEGTKIIITFPIIRRIK